MIRTLMYDRGNIIKYFPVNEIPDKINTDVLIWIDIEKPDDEELTILSNIFKFHPLAVEDCIHSKQRSKVDNYKDYYFIVLNAFKGRDINRHFTYSEIFMFVGKNYLVTLHWSGLNIIDEVYERASGASTVFDRGIDFLLYSIFDAIVDDYFPLTDKIGEKIDILEEVIFKNPSRLIQNEILMIKRNMLKLRKIISAQREVLNILLRHDFPLIKDENRLYFMDVYDHLMRLFDLIDTYQDMLAGTLDLYMSQMSNRMNEIMKILTIITTIMMPLTLITGIYGMNFQYIPELNMHYGYFIVLAAMGVIVILEIIYFRIKKWL